MRKQIPADKTTDVVEFSKMNPVQRLSSVTAGLSVREISIAIICSSYGFSRCCNMDRANMFELLV